MGLLTRKVTVDSYFFESVFEEPLKRHPLGRSKRKLNPIQKDFLNQFLLQKSKGYKTKDIVYNQIIQTKDLHEKEWVSRRTSFKKEFNLQILKDQSKDALTKALHTPHEILNYYEGFSNNLAYEYAIAKQLDDYSFTSKQFSLNGYFYKLNLEDFSVTCIDVPRDILEANLKHKVGQLLSLTSLGLYKSYKEYVTINIAPLGVEAYLNAYFKRNKQNIKDIKEGPEQHIVYLLDKPDRSFLKFKYITTYTSYQHRDMYRLNGELQFLNIYYNVEVPFDMPYRLFELFAMESELGNTDLNYFIEAITQDKKRIIFRKVIKAKDKLEKVAKKEKFSTPIPLKNFMEFDEKSKEYKDWIRALEQVNYKSKVKRKKSKKKNKNENDDKSLFEKMLEDDKIKEIDIAQYLDLKWFFLKEIREDKDWQRYLRGIMEYFASISNPAKYYHQATGYKIPLPLNYRRNRAGFRIKMIKREVVNTPCEKKCFISTEPKSSALILYLNVPNVSKSNPELLAQGKFDCFTQYGLDLSYWYECPNFYLYGISRKDITEDINPLCTWTLRGNVTELTKAHPLENTPKQLYIPNGFYYDFDIASWETVNGKVWANTGEVKDEKKYKPQVILNQAEFEELLDNLNDKKEYQTRSGKTYIPSEQVVYLGDFTYDDDINYIPEVIGIEADNEDRGKFRYKYEDGFKRSIQGYTPLMPKKLWLKTPYKVRMAVYPMTLFVAGRSQQEVKKGTWLGRALGFIFVIIGIVLIYTGVFAWLGKIFLSLGLGILASQYQNKFLAFLAQIVAVYNIVAAPWTGVGALQITANVLAVVNLTLQAVNYLTANRQKGILADMIKEAEETQKEAKEYKERLAEEQGRFVSLRSFNIDIDTEGDIDMIYSISYGEPTYDMMESGSYYEPDFLLGSLYDRFQ